MSEPINPQMEIKLKGLRRFNLIMGFLHLVHILAGGLRIEGRRSGGLFAFRGRGFFGARPGCRLRGGRAHRMGQDMQRRDIAGGKPEQYLLAAHLYQQQSFAGSQ